MVPKIPVMYSRGPPPSSNIAIALTDPFSADPPDPPPLGNRGLAPTFSQTPAVFRATDPWNGDVKSPPAYSFIPLPSSNAPRYETTVALGLFASTVHAVP